MNRKNIRKGKGYHPILIESSYAIAAFGIALVFYFQVAYTRPDPLEHTLYIQTNMLYPAIFFAAGHGMATADISRIPELESFTFRRSSKFNIRDIPEDITLRPLTTVWEITHLYYIYAVGWLWRIFGVSVWVVVLYAALLRAFMTLAVYGILRLLAGRTASFIGALLICTSPVVLHHAIDLRDFGKAPFILGELFFIGLLLRHHFSPAQLIVCAAGIGLLVGIGLGFRQDVFIGLPILLITLILFTRLNSSRPWLYKALNAAVILLVFFVTAFPILRGIAMEGGQASLHAFFHGISPETERKLNFGHASYESLVSTDPAAFSIVNVYARRHGHKESMVNTRSAEYLREQGDTAAPLLWDPFIYFTGSVYAKYANQVIGKTLLLFPADFVSRGWCAVFALPRLPYWVCKDMMAANLARPKWLDVLLIFHKYISIAVLWTGLAAILAVLIGISSKNLTLGLYLTVLLAFFAGYPTLWYDYRHFFFLAFIPLGAVVICAEQMAKVLHAYWQKKPQEKTIQSNSHIKRTVCVYLILLFTAFVVPVTLLRVWQTRNVMRYAEKLSTLSLLPVKVTIDEQDNTITVTPSQPLPGLQHASELPPGEVAWEYVAAVFDTFGEDIPVKITYDNSRFLYSLTQDITVKGVQDGTQGRVTLFFPVYETDMNYGGELMPKEILKAYPSLAGAIRDERPLAEQVWWKRGKFLGLSFSKDYEKKFVGFYRVKDVESLPLLPIFQLPESKTFLGTYKTCAWERWLREWF